ncbi:MAG: M42 family metallopeptidase [Flavobacteriales bacterium]
MSKEKLLDAKSLSFLERYLNTPAPTGFESAGQKVWLDYIEPYVDETLVDNYGSAAGITNPKADYKVVVEAHADEISWFVNHITDAGLIYVIRNGGSDHQIAPSKRVCIHTRKGMVPGVFGWPAIHTRDKAKEESPKLENIFIDIGATSRAEVVNLGVHVGCVITYPDSFMVLNDRYYVCRALDNRIGGFMIAQVARLLQENEVNLPFALYIVNSVQEEVGLRGAEMMTQRIKPDVALVTDVTHDTSTPMIDKRKEGDLRCGKGPVLAYAPAVQHNLRDLLVDTAEKCKIPFQRAALSRATGTDTDAFAYSNGGVVSALVSLPLRYMHTTVEMVEKNDVDNVIRLLFEGLKNMRHKRDFRYLR